MTQNEITIQKSILRRAGREARAALSARERAEKSQQLCAGLLRLWNDLSRREAALSARPVAVYLANEREADIDAFACALLSQQALVVAPRMNENVLFYALQSTLSNVETVPLDAGRARLRQPRDFTGGRAYEPHQIGVFVVPGVAFDARGNRIGQGGGWYDKVLCSAPGAVSIGVCFDCQVFDVVPQEAHDCRVQWIVTESRILDCRCV